MPSNKSKAAERLREDPSLQDGGDSEPERHTPYEGSHGKAGPQGHILECANTPTRPAVSEILLGGQSIQIFVPTFRPCSSSDDFYQTAETALATFLRKQGIRVIIYLDDMLLMAHSETDLFSSVKTTMNLWSHLGFILNTKKCQTEPQQMIEFLGFVVNTNKMTLPLPKNAS